MSLSEEQMMMEAQRKYNICLVGAFRKKEEMMEVLYDECYEPYRQFVKKTTKRTKSKNEGE